MVQLTPQDHLRAYATERLPEMRPDVFEGAPDIPHFTVDQHFKPLMQLPYSL